ncbi:c-type cytochrome [Actibacterium ureilyticum]|uniref:c-type cytochrome n=1 Tax=Actibacterium ureilyticum TaxID=1590614 RepID=UPI000BAAD5F7|nr:cytochrome c [Actibacterium ureilyticum]
MTPKFLLLGAGAVAAIAAIALLRPAPPDAAPPQTPPAPGAMVAVSLPPITGDAAIGQRIFDTACATCHGPNGAGNEGAGPPLIHVIYEPGHHADESFQRAVAMGVQSHHWRFGDMPPVGGLTRGDVAMVIAYIRAIQRANGID